MTVDNSSIFVFDGLGDAGPKLKDQAGLIADELASLLRQLKPIEETWSGWAASYYEPLQQEWNTAAAGLIGPDGVLGIIAHQLGVVWGNYCDAEGANADTWQLSS